MSERLRWSIREAVVAMAALLVTLASALAVDPEPGPAVLAILLTISLSRSQLERDVRSRLEAGLVLPLIALAGAGTGALLRGVPWLGAGVFTLAVTLSVYLRRFGETSRRFGALIGLPFTALLVVPGYGDRHSAGAGIMITIGVGLVAWIAVTVLQQAALRIGFLVPHPGSERPVPERAGPERAGPERASSSMRPDPTTRLAIQMMTSVGLSFVIGMAVFPRHWAWIVLTALLVALGNAERADVVHKGIQRILGAGAGSVVALGPLLAPRLPHGVALVLILITLFAGLVLRPFGYGFWALCITVVLALLQGLSTGRFSLWQRWGEIAIGAVLSIGVAWFLFPVRSESTIRRRIADLFAALSDWLAVVAPGHVPADLDAPGAHDLEAWTRMWLGRFERVAGPFDAAARWLPAAWQPRATGWVLSAREITLGLLREPRAAARRPLGEARRALRTPAELQPALDALIHPSDPPSADRGES